MPTNQTRSTLAEALSATLITNDPEDGMKPANVADVLNRIECSLSEIAFGDERGNSYLDLLERSIDRVADAIVEGLHDVADAIREAADLPPRAP